MSVNLTIPNRTPDFVVHGSEQAAPAANTVLASAGPAPVTAATSALVYVVINGDDAVPTYEIAHRNAANSADLEVSYIAASEAPGAFVEVFFLAAGEFIVVRNKTAGTSGKTYQAGLYVYRQ